MSTTLTPSPAPPREHPYPVHVHADAQPDPSRWLWLVKWLLLIPHLVVLALLWVAFVVLSVVAFVAILVTGRYPRDLFDFNVGVMRWSWRVSYYGYNALATDRYPPFTLSDVPDYPAHLDVDYPEHLSRGLVLVKWWLLALPHYLIVGILVGGGTWWIANDDSPARYAWGGGLVGLLVLVGAVVLALTGHYPGGLYDLVLGLNRWVLRVGAYAALMTDDYPPFRLDLGPGEPGDPRPFAAGSGGPAAPTAGSTADPAPVTSNRQPLAGPGRAPGPSPTIVASAPPRAPVHAGWSTGSVVAVVLGSLIGLASLVVLTCGVSALVADTALRDSAGYLTSPERDVRTTGYAVAMPSVRVDPAGSSVIPQRVMGDVRLRATAREGATIFVGIAPAADVDRYLGGVARSIPDDGWSPGREVAGAPPSGPPADEAIWDASVVGTGTQEMTWKPRGGDWAVVLMNADGSADVSARVTVGAQLPWLGGVGVALLVMGLVLLGTGVTLVATAVRSASRHPAGSTA